ncbi:MAG: CYTH domain-containing protein [Lachnospiraceae bacterium]|nr:CYTH domain-containing protein [Lachnospiraceae bacterium]
MGQEIERKFLIKELPSGLEGYPKHRIEQGYLNVDPALRVRREDDHYYMTYKGARSSVPGEIGQAEYNLPLDEASYEHLVEKADGNVIRKTRYILPLNDDAFEEDYRNAHPALSGLRIELDVFDAPFDGRVLAEVEFPNEEAARLYRPAAWFSEDVTGDRRYSNAHMSTEAL